MAKAFGGLPGIHKRMMDNMMKGITGKSMPVEIKKVEETAKEAVKGALLISGADKCQFGKLKDELANNYLLGTDQYPNTSDKALQILGNYRNTRGNMQYREDPNDTGVAFLQQGGRGGRGTGQGGQGPGHGDKNDESLATSNNISTMTGRTGTEGPKTNSKGESHCFHCCGATHWAYECP
jgi:hypothetical protein